MISFTGVTDEGMVWNAAISCLQLKEALETSYREKDKLQSTLQITQDKSMTRIKELKEVGLLHHSHTQ